MLTLFSSRKTIRQSNLLWGMTDVHSHLLPGVDDGVPNEVEALRILKYLQEIGVSRLYLTPHIMGDLEKNTSENLKERFDAFARICPDWIELRLAGEYLLDSCFEKQRKTGLLVMNGRHVLVETSYMSAPPDFLNMLYDLSLDGYTPILAHPERYLYMADEDYRVLKDRGYKFQLNLMSLHGIYGRRAAQVSHRLLKNEYYDYAGSDLHWLGVYEDTVEHLLLTRTEQQQLKALLENNHSLW